MSDRRRNLMLLHVLACNPLVTEAEARHELGLPAREPTFPATDNQGVIEPAERVSDEQTPDTSLATVSGGSRT